MHWRVANSFTLLLAAAAILITAASAQAQLFSNSTLNGRYGFVELLVSVDTAGDATNATSAGGVITFDGMGGYTLQGSRGSGADASASFTASGTYTVASNGFLTLVNPLNNTLSINGRVGINAEAIVGSSTEAVAGTYDMLIAVRLGTNSSNATLSGRYSGGSLLFPNGLDTNATTAMLTMNATGGNFSTVSIVGHAAGNNDLNVSQSASGATYMVNANGTGTAAFGTGASLFRGDKNIFVSSAGNYMLGYSMAAGVRAIFATVRHLGAASSNASWNSDYWMTEMVANVATNTYSSATGALRARGAGVAAISQRIHLPDGNLNFSGVNAYAIDPDSRGFLGAGLGLGVTNLVIGAPVVAAGGDTPGPSQAGPVANAFAGANVDAVNLELPVHGIYFGVRVPSFSGAGVFLAPLGVINAASFAPTTFPISGGTLLSLFGVNLANSTEVAGMTPLPTNLGGTTVTINGVLSPLFFVSTGQINLQVPFATSGANATVVVTNNGTASNSVVVPVSNSSPGIFSAQQTGFGPGIITHADFSLVTENSPAAPGETVIIFLTGGGPINPAFGDGEPGPGAEPFARLIDTSVQVLVGAEAGNLIYAGAAPNFVGLYQFNLTIPNTVVGGVAVPIAIVTSDSFTDFVDISIGL